MHLQTINSMIMRVDESRMKRVKLQPIENAHKMIIENRKMTILRNISRVKRWSQNCFLLNIVYLSAVTITTKRFAISSLLSRTMSHSRSLFTVGY